jgi:tRNA threonylcarbamoyladenosine biosynthesis protein TsaB
MLLLAIDTSASLCAAAVFDGEQERGRAVIDIGKGHAEHLMGVIDEALAAAGVGYKALARIAVAVGPGSFTGIRVGVSTARGLALALGVPAVGVSNLEAVAAEAREKFAGKAIVPAFLSARESVQLAVYDPFAKLVYPPSTMSIPDAAALAREHAALVCGSAASALVAIDPELVAGSMAVTTDIAIYARLGAAQETGEKPKPLYLREPDAKPQASFVLPRTVP